MKTIDRLEHGHFYWATIESALRDKIEELLGPFPVHEEPVLPAGVNLRTSPDGTVLSSALVEEIEQIIRESENKPHDKDEVPDSVATAIGSDAVDYYCRCTKPVMLKHDGRCPYCNWAVDNGY